MNCVVCNKIIPDDSKFCCYCGAEQTIRCKCGFIPPQDASFCPQCGIALIGSSNSNYHKNAIRKEYSRPIKLRNEYYIQLIKEGRIYSATIAYKNDMVSNGQECPYDEAFSYINKLQQSL